MRGEYSGSIVRAMINGRTKGKLLTMVHKNPADKAPVPMKRNTGVQNWSWLGCQIECATGMHPAGD